MPVKLIKYNNMGFLNSYLGMYMVQSVFHSLVTLLMVEMSLRIWQVESVRERFLYRLQVIILPFVMYPVFQLMNPDRGTFYFVEDSAFFSSMRWLRLDLFGLVPLYWIFLLILMAVSVLVIVQEVIPLIKDGLAGFDDSPGIQPGPGIEKMLEELSTALKVDRPSAILLEDRAPVIYTTGTRGHSIVISEGLMEIFDESRLKSALAHELAHIARRSNIVTILVFIVRICMFYNPVSLLEFRRIVQDDEQICDDITVSKTGDPKALADALRVFYTDDEPGADNNKSGISLLSARIERSSHNLLLIERIRRLENSETHPYQKTGWFRYLLVMAAIVAVNYHVV